MTKKILEEIFLKSKKTRSLIGIYSRDITTEDLIVGYVLDFEDNFIVLQHVTEYGEKDGIYIKQIETIHKIETKNDYLNGCQTLLKNPHPLAAQTLENVSFSFSEAWQYHFLNDNSCIGQLITFDLTGEEFFYFGFLMDFDQDSFSVQLVGQAGESLGTGVFNLADVASFGLDTLQCRKRRYLFNLKRKTGAV